ncbi:MAG: hypothetical protein ACUVUG_04660 [Candidatus Aminicenantia bacterium]
MNVPSKEGLNISLYLSFLFHIDSKRAPEIYKTLGPDYRGIFLRLQDRASAKGITVLYEAKALHTSERELLAKQILESLKNSIVTEALI